MKPQCPGCRAGSPSVVRDGHFKRHCDSRLVQRFHCHHCGRRFSASTPSPRCRQKCRRINPFVQILMCSGVSQRRLAKLLRVSRTTLVRRIRFLAKEARESIPATATGQGELKKARHDWLFSINHTLAMLRANINRLIRRTWCTSKVNARLDDHIALYADYHNRLLIHSAAR